MSGTDRAVRLVIRGRVQGVGFRAFVAEEAGKLGVGGWVRNRRDGTVEAAVAGPSAAVEAMIEACRQGPLGSRVIGVDVSEPAAGEARGEGPMSILPTA